MDMDQAGGLAMPMEANLRRNGKVSVLSVLVLFITLLAQTDLLAQVKAKLSVTYDDRFPRFTFDATSSEPNGVTFEWYQWRELDHKWEKLPDADNDGILHMNGKTISPQKCRLRIKVRVSLSGDYAELSRCAYKASSHNILAVSVDSSELTPVKKFRMPLRINEIETLDYNLIADRYRETDRCGSSVGYPNIRARQEDYPKLLLAQPVPNEVGIRVVEWMAISVTGSRYSICEGPCSGYFDVDNNCVRDVIQYYGDDPDEYHNGEDWNMVRGDDLSKSVFSIGDGVVIYARYSLECSGAATVGVLHKFIDPDEPWDLEGLSKHRYVVSEYWHLEDIHVKPGQLVSSSDSVGQVGTCGTEGSHLHFQMLKEIALDSSTEHEIMLLRSASTWPGKSPRDIERDHYEPSRFILDFSRPKISHVRIEVQGNEEAILETHGAHFSPEGFPASVRLFSAFLPMSMEPIEGLQLVSYSDNAMKLRFPWSGESDLLVEKVGSIEIDNGIGGPVLIGLPFSDVSSLDYYQEAAVYYWHFGVIEGRRDGRFDGGSAINRAEFIKILISVMELDRQSPLPRGIIPLSTEVSTQWFYPYVEKAYGFKNTRNGGEPMAYWDLIDIASSDFWAGEISRSEAAHLLMNARLLGPRVPNCQLIGEVPGCLRSFSDVAPGSPEAEWIYATRAAGIFEGYPDNSFRPDHSINRAESVKILFTAFGRDP